MLNQVLTDTRTLLILVTKFTFISENEAVSALSSVNREYLKTRGEFGRSIKKKTKAV